MIEITVPKRDSGRLTLRKHGNDVREFQREHGLKVDGKVGVQTFYYARDWGEALWSRLRAAKEQIAALTVDLTNANARIKTLEEQQSLDGSQLGIGFGFAAGLFVMGVVWLISSKVVFG